MNKFCRNIILVFSAAVICLLTLFNLVSSASVAQNASELVSLSWNSPIILCLTALLAILLFFLPERLFFISEKKLFFALAFLYILAGLYLILNISPVLRADAALIHEAALSASEGDFSFLAIGADIRNHPHQLGMITFERILGLFSKNTQWLFWVNLFAVLGINYLTYKLADLVFAHNHKTNVLTLLFSFAFLPQFFFIAFAYGLIPGFFCILCAFYFQQRYFAEGKKPMLVYSLLLAVFSVLLKGNMIIGVITMAILFIMKTFQRKKIFYTVLALFLLLCTVLSGKAINAVYEWESGIPLEPGEPKILWIAMGIDPENQWNAPGWYNGYNDFTFGKAEFNADRAAEMAKASIRGSISYHISHPGEAAGYFGRKITSVWCDPLFQSIWSGPLEDCGQSVSTRILASVYHGAALEHYFRIFMKSFILLLLFLAVLSVFNRENRCAFVQYAWLYLIGGFLLHLVWEGKSQYVYPYIFILIPVCANECSAIYEKRRNKDKHKKAKKQEVSRFEPEKNI